VCFTVRGSASPSQRFHWALLFLCVCSCQALHADLQVWGAQQRPTCVRPRKLTLVLPACLTFPRALRPAAPRLQYLQASQQPVCVALHLQAPGGRALPAHSHTQRRRLHAGVERGERSLSGERWVKLPMCSTGFFLHAPGSLTAGCFWSVDIQDCLRKLEYCDEVLYFL